MSERYPELWVHPLGVRFADGIAEVDDPATAARLTNVDGVLLADGETPPASGSGSEGGGEQQSDSSGAPAPDGDGQEEADAPEAEPEQARPEPPAVSEPKAQHVDYAVTVFGLPRAEIEAMTKADLVDLIRSNRG